MKSWLILVFLLFSSNCFAEFAIIQDNDGFVNVRKKPDLTSEVAYKLKENEVFYAFSQPENGFYEILIKDVNNNMMSDRLYIHASRVKFLSTFDALDVRVDVGEKSGSKGDIFLNGFDYSMQLGEIEFQKDKHHLEYSDSDKSTVKTVDGYSVFWGSDYAVPYSEYRVFSIKYQGKPINLPQKMIGDLFNPYIKNTNAYFDKNTKKLYLELNNGDGAGVYRVIFEIKEDVIINRFVILDENA